jgi:pimeloyl-ACP methyl ester carboxylesterase
MDSFTNGELHFEVADDGPRDGQIVIALHGFPADRSSWAGIAAHLTPAGYRVLAPDQRGYSPGARPRRRRDYAAALLARDILALADQAGADRFDVVGHDWGAVVGWYLAARYPQRVRTLTALSVPHPGAVAQALTRSPQLLRSWYMAYFQLPVLAELTLSAGHGKALRNALIGSGLDPAHASRYAERAERAKALIGPLNWYRAIPFGMRERLPAVEVPTLFVWGDGDRFITRAAAERCGNFVRGRFRSEVFEGVSHWIPEVESERVAGLIQEHVDGG